MLRKRLLECCWGGLLGVLVLACGGSGRPDTNAENDPGGNAPGGAGMTSSGSGGDGGSGASGGSSGGAAGGGGGSGGNGGNGDIGAGGTGGGASPEGPGPEVTLLAPEDLDSPDLVFDDAIHVRCQVEQADAEDAAPPNPASVVLELLDADGEVLTEVPGVEGNDTNVFEASLPVTNVAAGMVEVRCTAADSALTPRSSSASVNAFVDHGPMVTVEQPEHESSRAPTPPVEFEFSVWPNELVEGDAGASVKDVAFSVRGKDFPIDEREDEPGTYTATIDFNDRLIFAEVPEGWVTFTLSAINQRDVTRDASFRFLMDSNGPRVAIESPDNNAIIDNTEVLEVSITDAGSGVNLDSLVVTLNGTHVFPYDASGPWSVSGDTVRFEFDANDIEGTEVQIGVKVEVEDNVGNASSATALYYLDEHPPFLSLDPPNFRQTRRTGEDTECSKAFDPLGESPNHGDDVDSTERVRVLVWERTNSTQGSDILYFSGVRPGSVDLFARPYSADTPLVIDTTGDGICDDIDVTPDIGIQNLKPITPQGSPPYGPEAVIADPPPLDCELASSSPTPSKLCTDNASDLYTVPHQSTSGNKVPVVYAVPELEGLECTGRNLELSTFAPGYEGWLCLAARAVDRVGNRGVSEPIAVCLGNGASCRGGLQPVPNCAPGCTPVPGLSIADRHYR